MDERWVLLGGAVNFLLTFTYIVPTLRGEVKPNRVTWFIWALAPMLATAAEINKGVGLVAFTTFMSGFSPLLILLASFMNKKAYWELGRLDFLCGALALLGLVLWQGTREGNWAILFAIVADFLAAVPTLVKAYRFPKTENSLTFAGGLFNALVGLCVLPVWNFEHAAFPTYLVLIDGALIVLVGWRGRALRGNPV